MYINLLLFLNNELGYLVASKRKREKKKRRTTKYKCYWAINYVEFNDALPQMWMVQFILFLPKPVKNLYYICAASIDTYIQTHSLTHAHASTMYLLWSQLINMCAILFCIIYYSDGDDYDDDDDLHESKARA